MSSCSSKSMDEHWFQKMVGSLVFLWNQSINSFILRSGLNFWRPIIKRKEIIMWIRVYPYWEMNFNSKNGRKKSFRYETKASISLIPIRRMCLWYPIVEQRRLIHEFVPIPIDRWTLIPKNGGKSRFSMKAKHQFVYPNEWNEFTMPSH